MKTSIFVKGQTSVGKIKDEIKDWDALSDQERYDRIPTTQEFRRLAKLARIRWWANGNVELYASCGCWCTPEQWVVEEQIIIVGNVKYNGVSCLLCMNRVTKKYYAECPGKYNWISGHKRDRVYPKITL